MYVCFCCVILLFFANFEVRLVFMVMALAGAAARTRRPRACHIFADPLQGRLLEVGRSNENPNG